MLLRVEYNVTRYVTVDADNFESAVTELLNNHGEYSVLVDVADVASINNDDTGHEKHI